MLLTVASLKDMLSTIAFMALLAVVLGVAMRKVERLVLAQLGLAALSAPYVLSIFLLPWSVAWPAFVAVAPFLLPLHVLGVLVVGNLMERERQMMAAERFLAREAARDPLTGLLNRHGFEAAVLRAGRSAWGSALLVLDLDHSKHINDAHGHAAGDAVLRALGPRLQEALGADATVARFGGEEVVVFLPTLGPATAGSIARRLCRAVRVHPFVLPDGASVNVTASVGGAWSEAPVALDELMARADAALYEAKSAGRNGWRLDDQGAAARAAQACRRAAARAA